jgi:hypothetical protein
MSSRPEFVGSVKAGIAGGGGGIVVVVVGPVEGTVVVEESPGEGIGGPPIDVVVVLGGAVVVVVSPDAFPGAITPVMTAKTAAATKETRTRETSNISVPVGIRAPDLQE